MKQFAFIGAGNMGGAIVRGVCRSVDPAEVVVYRPTRSAAGELARETGCCLAADGAEAAGQGKYVVLCVKPQQIRPVLESLLPTLRERAEAGQRQVVVSIAAGVTLEAIRQVLAGGGLDLPVVRMMPNTPAAIGRGVLLMTALDTVTPEDRAELDRGLAGCGLLEWTTEPWLDMGSTIAGCGPAFVYLFIEALADGGVQIGLPRDKAQTWAAQMVAGAAGMVLETGKHPGRLKDEVCSPGGSTIAGVAALERCGFRAAASQAVTAAWEKNKVLGK